jgi:hypothetical protein
VTHIHVPSRFHDDVELTEDEFHKFTLETKDVDDGLNECTYTLTIPSGCHKDTGQYRFTAKNKFGKDECSVSNLQGHFRHVNTIKYHHYHSTCRLIAAAASVQMLINLDF